MVSKCPTREQNDEIDRFVASFDESESVVVRNAIDVLLDAQGQGIFKALYSKILSNGKQTERFIFSFITVVMIMRGQFEGMHVFTKGGALDVSKTSLRRLRQIQK